MLILINTVWRKSFRAVRHIPSKFFCRKPGFSLLIISGLVLCGNVHVGSAQQAPANSATSAATNGTAPPPPQLKADLNRILAGREFQPQTSEKSQLTDLVAQARRMWERLREWWSNLFRLSGVKGGSTLLIYILLAFILSGLLWVVYRMFRDWSPREHAAQPRRIVSEEDEALAEIERDPDMWLTQAEEWAAQSDYRRAFRAVFLALLLQLDRAGALSYDRARTNGEYLRHLQQTRALPLYDALVPLAVAFETRWYGDTPTSAQDYQAIREAYKRLPLFAVSAASAPATTDSQIAQRASLLSRRKGRQPMTTPRRHIPEYGIIAVLLGVFLIIALLAEQAGQSVVTSTSASSLNANPAGSKALYALLETIPLPARRLTSPWYDLRSSDGMVVIVEKLDKKRQPDQNEINALRNWTQAGGTTLYFLSEPARPLDPQNTLAGDIEVTDARPTRRSGSACRFRLALYPQCRQYYSCQSRALAARSQFPL